MSETPADDAKPRPPAGWYNDPEMVNTRRYWDGEAWTDHRQEASVASSTPEAAPADAVTAAPASAPRKGGRGWLIAGLVFIAIVVVGSILGNSGGSKSDNTDPDSSAPSKYQQTWSKDYAHTSCDEWTNTMDPHQRFAAAADMLTGARNKGDGGTGVPDDDLVKTFEQGLDNACVEPTSNLAEIGAALYLTERSTFRP